MDVFNTARFVMLGITCCVLSTWIMVCSQASSLSSNEDEALSSEILRAKPQSRNILQYKHLAYPSMKRRGQVLISRWKRQTGANRRGSKQHKKPRMKDKRSLGSADVDEYQGFHINLTTCGAEKSCIRIGSKNCGHRQCTYILTFKTIGDSVEFEISGRTKGWVAVGFSSDSKMGGDDVVACIHSVIPSKIRASALINPYSHEKPQENDIQVNMTAAEYKDGYVSCRVQRRIAPDGAMDLTNDWYQLYAWGSVVSNGLMMRHDMERPPTSSQTYTLLRRDINIVRSLTNGAWHGGISTTVLVLSACILLAI